MGSMPVTEFEGALPDPAAEERPGRERDNSMLLTALMVWLYQRRNELGIEVFPCQDIRVSPSRRVTADICVTIGEPDEQVFTKTPLLCVEILSIFVPMWKVLAKVADYLNFGVPYVWVIDPRKQKGTVYTAKDSITPEDGILRTENPEIALPLADLF